MDGHTIFGRSDVRREILRLFFSRPGVERHVREIARELGRAAPPVSRELRALERDAILTSATIGRARRYRVNERSRIAPQIRTLVQRTLGVEATLRAALRDLDGVEEAFVYGSYASGKERSTSDIDVMVVGDVSRRVLSDRLRPVEETLGRDVNVTRYTRQEFERLRRARDPFVQDVLGGERIQLTPG